MNREHLLHFEEWFDTFTRGYFSADPDEQKNIALKVEHSERVRGIIADIAEAQSLGAEEVLLAESVGLFHDIGRFPQYAHYKTFRDSISVNHGKLGAEVLEKEGILQGLPGREQEIVTTGVRFHNAFAIPELPSGAMLLILRLIRDADKLDIWHIFTGFFEMPAEKRPSEAGLGLPDTPGYSRELVDAILKKQTASLAHVKRLNDFMLMQLSWITDLNFGTSFRLLQEGDYINRIASLLPQTEEIRQIARFLHDYAESRM